MNPHCDLEFEDSKPIFLRNTMAHDDASSYQVWLQKVQQLGRYRQDEHSSEFWLFPVTLTTTKPSNLFIRQSSLWWYVIKPSLAEKTIRS